MLEAVLHWIGFGLCHQLPERSFFGASLQLPVCARDTGIYVGFLVSAAVMYLTSGRRATELPRRHVLAAGAIFFAIMTWDGVTSYSGMRATTNDIRLATGLLAGFALPLMLVPMLNGELWPVGGRERPLDTPGQFLAWILALPASFAVVRWGLPLLGAGYAIVAAAAVVATFCLVNLLLVAMVRPRGRAIEGFRDLLLPLAVSFVLTLIELALSGALRTALTSVPVS